MVELAIGGHLALAIVVEQLDEEDVVVAYECHLVAVGRPYGYLLRASVGETLQQVALHVVDIEYRLVGAAVYRLRLCAYEHALAVGREYVAVEGVDFLANGVADVEEHGGLLARAERILHNLFPVLRDLRILVGAFQRVYAADALSRESTVGNRLQVYLAGCHDRRCGHKHNRTKNE